METEADRLVVKIDADLANFKTQISSAASVTEAGMTRISKATGTAEAALTHAGGVSGQTRLAMLELGHVARGAGDQFAAGTPLVQIFSQHLGQAAQAASLAGNTFGKLGTFLGGPWGIALTLGTVVLAKLATTHTTAKNSVEGLLDKMKQDAEHTDHSRLAHEAFTKTLEGQLAAMRAVTDQMEKGFVDQFTDEVLTLRRAKKTLELAVAQKEIADKELEAAKQKRDAAVDVVKTATDPRQAAGLATQAAAAQSAVDRAQDKVDGLARGIADAQRHIAAANVTIAASTGEMIADQAKGITAHYDALITLAKTSGEIQINAALAAGKATDKLTDGIKKQVTQYERLRKAELDALAASQKKFSNAQSGREVTADQAAAIARAAGLQVNSASRTNAQQQALYNQWVAAGRPSNNPVAMPGSSAHEGARGRWALDIQFGQGVTPELLRKVFAAQGINLTKVLQERGHFHIEGSRSQADAADAAQTRAAEQENARQKKVADETAGEDKAILEAKRALAGTIQEQAAIDLKLLDLAQQKFNADLNSQVAANKLDPTKGITEAEAKVIEALNDQATGLRRQLITRNADSQLSQQRLTIADTLLANQEEILQSEQGLAVTAKDRRDLALAILNIEYTRQKNALEGQLLDLEKNKADQKLIDSKKAEIAALGAVHSNNVTATKKDNQSPLGDYLKGLQDTATGINDQFEQIAVNGLNDFTSGIADAIVHFKSLGDVARSVLQSILQAVLQLIIKMIVLKVVETALGLGGGGSVSTGAGGSAGGFGAVGGVSARTGGAIRRAVGGPSGFVTGPGTDTSDSIPVWLSNGEYVLKASSVRKLGIPLLEALNRDGRLPLHRASGGVAMPSFSPMNMQARPGGGGGNSELSPAAVATLRGIVADALYAMPNVQVINAIDSGEMVERGIATRRGGNALVGFNARNSRAVGSSLRR